MQALRCLFQSNFKGIFMIEVTQQQRDNALYARDVMWPAVPAALVVSELSRWRCGTQACFGGHVAKTPYFQEQGVIADDDEAPWMDDCVDFMEVADKLFGHPHTFNSRSYGPEEDFDGVAKLKASNLTDHELVTARLNFIINNSTVEG